MNNAISDLTDAAFEQIEDIKKAVKLDVVKGIPQTVKQQVFSNKSDTSNESNFSNRSDKSDKKQSKTDPVTGKPVPPKQILRDLQQKVAQLQAAKLKKIREELEQQRLKITGDKAKLSPIEIAKHQGTGPAVPTESPEKAPDNAVANTLKGSKSTGEFKGLVGG